MVTVTNQLRIYYTADISDPTSDVARSTLQERAVENQVLMGTLMNPTDIPPIFKLALRNEKVLLYYPPSECKAKAVKKVFYESNLQGSIYSW